MTAISGQFLRIEERAGKPAARWSWAKRHGATRNGRPRPDHTGGLLFIFVVYAIFAFVVGAKMVDTFLPVIMEALR